MSAPATRPRKAGWSESGAIGKRGGTRYATAMWNEPYLETCCRSALHRLTLCGDVGRPAGLKDGGCLERLRELGFCAVQADGRYHVTPAGGARHRREVLGEPVV